MQAMGFPEGFTPSLFQCAIEATGLVIQTKAILQGDGYSNVSVG